jgi:chromosome segregation ATPase
MTCDRRALACLATSALLSLALGGCGGASLSHTIDEDKLKEASRQGLIWIYDAENEIVVALDRLDEGKDDLRRVRLRLREAEEMLEAAEAKKSRLGVEMAESWIKYLERLEDWAEENIDSLKIGIVVAQATVELAKAQVINREDLLGGKGFSIKVYQHQYNRLKKRYQRSRKRIRKMRTKARKLEEKWWTLRQRFVAQTGDYESGLWIK